MSKLLKFIVHFIVILMILIVLALAVPPFFGVTTQIQDETESRTNLPIGSVAYAVPRPTAEAKIGDPILVTEDQTVYNYVIAALNPAENRGTVVDASVANAEPVKVAFGEYYPKVALVVPLIGYLLMATQSTEGIVILVLIVLFLIILYIIAELWKKNPADEMADSPEIMLQAADYDNSVPQAYFVKPAKSDRKSSGDRKIRTGGFVDEVDESDFEDEDDYDEEYPEDQVLSATSEAHEVLKKEIAATTQDQDTSDEKPLNAAESGSRPRKSARPYPSGASSRQQPQPAEEEEKPIRKLAIPRYSASQLAQAAKRAGDNPEVIRDDVTDVTLFDYSDLFADAESSLDEEGDF